jgi:hypothetical protein
LAGPAVTLDPAIHVFLVAAILDAARAPLGILAFAARAEHMGFIGA